MAQQETGQECGGGAHRKYRGDLQHTQLQVAQAGVWPPVWGGTLCLRVHHRRGWTGGQVSPLM